MLEAEMDFEYERWVVGYEGKYSVTRDGRVFSHLRGKKVEKKQSNWYNSVRRSYSYPSVLLSFNGVLKTHTTHRLVAMAFLDNPNEKPCVNHIDGDKKNNSIENLEWVTYSENVKHAQDQGLSSTYRLTRVERYVRTKEAITGTTIFKGNRVVCEQDLIRNNIPPEVVNVKIRGDNYLTTWLNILRIFEVCDSTNTLSEAAQKLKVDPSNVSYIRNGFRCKKERRIYDKYKDDPYYRVHG